METVKVKINKGGLTAKEINPTGEEPVRMIAFKRAWAYTQGDLVRLEEFRKDLKTWKDAEALLREFEIDGTIEEFNENSIYEAEILTNGKIKLIANR